MKRLIWAAGRSAATRALSAGERARRVNDDVPMVDSMGSPNRGGSNRGGPWIQGESCV